MSLQDVVLEIADEMERAGNALVANADRDGALAGVGMKDYAKQLRRAVKASEGYRSPVSTPDEFQQTFRHKGSPLVDTSDPEVQKVKALIEAETKHTRKITNAEEGLSTDMLTFVGGPFDGELAPLDSSAPVGAKIPAGNAVYVLTPERRLEFSQEETDKYLKVREGR